MLLALIAQRATPTNLALVEAAPRGVDFRILAPTEALETVGPGDAVLGRLDVLDTLDGVDDGLWALGSLAARGVSTLNRASALMAAHDKLLTARLLLRAGLPHPRTRLLSGGRPLPELDGPVVVKPRFGSWGRDVVRCEDAKALRRHVRELEQRAWFRAHGALVQELVPPRGHDLRVVVAAGTVVGAISRIAKPGEWRTNVALGASRVAVDPPEHACELALRAAAAAGTELLGVDLLPDGSGGYTVLELNGAVEFTAEYALDRDPFAAAAWELSRRALRCPQGPSGRTRPASLRPVEATPLEA
ncbi:MAG: RimK family alpha-L-glutamate ligase [Actinobacteria bacterium]|nr:RimK family alpha-L-glutamate ligase [Actinomycetota bacterium]